MLNKNYERIFNRDDILSHPHFTEDADTIELWQSVAKEEGVSGDLLFYQYGLRTYLMGLHPNIGLTFLYGVSSDLRNSKMLINSLLALDNNEDLKSRIEAATEDRPITRAEVLEECKEYELCPFTDETHCEKHEDCEVCIKTELGAKSLFLSFNSRMKASNK